MLSCCGTKQRNTSCWPESSNLSIFVFQLPKVKRRISSELFLPRLLFGLDAQRQKTFFVQCLSEMMFQAYQEDHSFSKGHIHNEWTHTTFFSRQFPLREMPQYVIVMFGVRQRFHTYLLSFGSRILLEIQ